MRVSDKLLRMLAILEQGPKYGRQIAVIAPELFVADNVVDLRKPSKRVTESVSLQNIYLLLKRAKKHGLVFEVKDFKSAREEDDPGSALRKYFAITADGRRLLSDTRKSIAKL